MNHFQNRRLLQQGVFVADKVLGKSNSDLSEIFRAVVIVTEQLIKSVSNGGLLFQQWSMLPN